MIQIEMKIKKNIYIINNFFFLRKNHDFHPDCLFLTRCEYATCLKLASF